MELIFLIATAGAIAATLWAVYLLHANSALRLQVTEQADLIDDLRSAIGGTETNDWRKQTL